MSDTPTLYMGGKLFNGTDSLDDHGVMVEGDTITAVKPAAARHWPGPAQRPRGSRWRRGLAQMDLPLREGNG